MKKFRLFAAVLIAAASVALASAQQSDDFTSLRSKAEKGNGIAQYNLGLAYAEGRGVAVDRLEAYVWLSLARENGARGRALDNLTASFDKATLSAAQQRLADRKGTSAEKIPVVTTTRAEPEILTTVKTTGDAAAATGADAASLPQQVITLTADKKQLSDEVAKAWKEIEVLNAALSKAENEVRSANPQALEQRTKDLKAVTAELESVGKFSRELEASLNRTNEQKALAEQNLVAAQSELSRTKTELAEQSQKVKKLAATEAARNTPSAETATLRSQLDAAQAELKELSTTKTALATAQAQSAALNTELAAERATETKLHDTIAQLEDEKKQLASVAPAYPDLSGKVGELEAQLFRANRNTEATAQAAAAASKQNIAELSASAAQILRLQSALDARSATPAYPDLSGKVRELEANVVSSTQKLAAANGAQTDLQRQLAEANAAAQNAAKTTDDSAKLRRERDEFSNRVTALSGENAELRSDRERMQKLLADSGKQQRDSTADASRIKILESQSAGLQTSLNAALAQVTTLQKSLAGKSDVPAYPDLSGKVRELESRLAATNQQADAAVQTAVATSKQSTADLNAASAQIAQLRADLAAKPAPAPTPDLSGRVRELENQLAAASTENARAKQEIVALGKARDEASKNRGPTYPNLAGRVVELQTALADTKRDLSDAQNALRAAEQARTAAAATAPVAVAAATGPVSATEPSDLQKQLADTESRLATALRGYAILQRDRDAQIDTASKSADAVTTERNALAAQVTTLTAELDQLKAGAANQTGAARAEVTRSSESLAALQRSTSQNAIDLANTRALLKQVQGANTVLANENYQLKSRLSPGSAPVPAANAAIAPVPAPTTTRTHIVATGDTLSRLSQRYYGTPSRWQEIYQANAGKLGTTGVLRIGVELTIP